MNVLYRSARSARAGKPGRASMKLVALALTAANWIAWLNQRVGGKVLAKGVFVAHVFDFAATLLPLASQSQSSTVARPAEREWRARATGNSLP